MEDGKLAEAIQFLHEQVQARITALEIEVRERVETLEQLRSVQSALHTLPLWGTRSNLAYDACSIIRDDEFGHLTMADAAAEVLRRSTQPMHAKDIWFSVMRGGYPFHSKSSYQVLVTCMNRLKSRFARVGPNVFTLVSAAGELEALPDAAGVHHV